MTAQNILVIKLGGLGDIVQAFGALSGIRAAHSRDHVTLMTSPNFAGFCEAMPWVDAVWAHDRPSPLRLGAWLALRRALGRFDRVYDLQSSRRTTRYWRIARPRPEWVGVRGSHPNPPFPTEKSNRERMAMQLAGAGIAADPAPDLSWLAADIAGLGVPARRALLLPGCSPHLPHKRWPHFPALAARLSEAGIVPVLAGTSADRDAIEAVLKTVPEAVDLSGRTSVAQLASLARGSAAVIGNDSGPVFLAASVGAPTLMLMSHHTDPNHSAPHGSRAAWLKRDDLAALYVAEVWSAIAPFLELVNRTVYKLPGHA